MTLPHGELHHFQTVRGFHRWTIGRQFVLPAMLAGGALSIFGYGVLESPIHDPQYASARLAHLAAILVAAAIMLLHSVYLLMMAQHLVYSQPVDRNLRFTPLVLALISAAYWIIGVNAALTFMSWPTISPFVTYGLFALSYSTLAVNGITEVRSTHFQLPRTRIATKYFLAVDGGFGLLFLWSTISAFSSGAHSTATAGESMALAMRDMTGVHPVFLAAVTNKEILIFLVLMFYRAARTVVDHHLAAQANSTYAAYQRHNGIPTTQDDSLRALGDSIGAGKSWFDYGCGSGERLVQLLELIYPAGSQAAGSVVLYDADPAVYDNLDVDSLKRLEAVGTHVEKGLELADPLTRRQRLAQVDVLLLSHVTYDPPRILGILEDLAYLREKAIVVVRVTGSTGLFRAISFMFSTRLVAPSSRHSVPQILMKELQKDYGFRQIRTGRIAQRYSLNETDAAADLARWCDIRYGEGIGLHVKYYAELLQQCGIADLPNDDDVYVLERVGAGKHPRPSTRPPAPPATPQPPADAGAAGESKNTAVKVDVVADAQAIAAVGHEKPTGEPS